MRNDIVLYTHNPLGMRHLKLSVESLLQGQSESFHWNTLYLYNAGSKNSTDEIINYLQGVEQINFSCDYLRVIEWDPNTKKTLAQDLYNIFSSYNEVGERNNVLLLKPDYCLSHTFHKEIQKYQNGSPFMWSLPVYSSKEWLDNNEIKSFLSSQGEFVDENDFIYCRVKEDGSETGNPFDETKPEIKYVGCKVSLDYNVHYFNSISSEFLYRGVKDCTWGGVANCFIEMKASGVPFIRNFNSYALHVYHEVFTKNNKSDRLDARKIIEGQRY